MYYIPIYFLFHEDFVVESSVDVDKKMPGAPITPCIALLLGGHFTSFVIARTATTTKLECKGRYVMISLI